jgi:3-deoxy-D-manno-octulosonic-acid transferase
MFLIYSLIYTIVIIILFLPEYLKRPPDFRAKWLREKMGALPLLNSSIWVHAVSVGEVNASLPLLERLKSAFPDHPLILSTITDTGQKVGLDKSPEGTVVVYLPFDIVFIINRCFKRVRPQIFIVMETELWPNVMRTAAENRVPVLMINGRISEKSSAGYQKISFFMKKVFFYVAKFGMQSQLDSDRIRKIGAAEDKVVVLGNLKFDMKIPGSIPAWTRALTGPVIVAGSTHKGEEEIIITAWQESIDKFPDLKLILAPRHPERFREVENMLSSKGVLFVKRSDLNLHPGALSLSNANVILLDTVGELSSVYGIADMAIIGKSFTGSGGQNPLEPAYWGKPILCGPHMENFPFIKDFYNEGAAFEVEAQSLSKKMLEFLSEPAKARSAGEKAKELYKRNSGAIERAMELIGEYITHP